MQTVPLNVDDEVKALGDALAAEIADVKAQKGAAAYLADATPALLSLAGNYAKLPADVKKADDLAYFVKCLATALIPQS